MDPESGESGNPEQEGGKKVAAMGKDTGMPGDGLECVVG